MSTNDEVKNRRPFGCSECGGFDDYFNAGKARWFWFVCHEHRERWCVGSNLLSSQHETEEEQRYAYEVDPGWGHYREVPDEGLDNPAPEA